MKLRPLTIILIGLSVGLSALAFAYFQYWAPNKAEAQMNRDQREALITEVNKRSGLKKTLADAEVRNTQLYSQWRDTVAQRSPSTSAATGGVDLTVNAWQLTVESRKYRNNVQSILNAQLRRGGVKVLDPAPFVTMPDDAAPGILASYYNVPPMPFPVVIFDLGVVRVQGTYAQIMDHIRAYKSMPQYFAVVHDVRLDGTAPVLTASYQLSIIGYIRTNEVYPKVPEVAGGNQQQGGGPGGGAPAGGGGERPRGKFGGGIGGGIQ